MPAINPLSIAVHSIAALSRRNALAFSFNRTVAKVDGLIACTARVGLIEFIGKDFFFLPALWTSTEKGGKVPEGLESRAMRRGRHRFHLLFASFAFHGETLVLSLQYALSGQR